MIDDILHVWSGWCIPVLFLQYGLAWCMLMVLGLILGKYYIVKDVKPNHVAIGIVIGSISYVLLNNL